MFSPSSLVKTLFGQATGGSKPGQSPITALMEGLKVAQKKIAETHPEAAAALEKVTGAPKMPRRLTKELREYESAQSEVEKMKKESAQFENPNDFAKYGKMQRQIIKMEKEL